MNRLINISKPIFNKMMKLIYTIIIFYLFQKFTSLNVIRFVRSTKAITIQHLNSFSVCPSPKNVYNTRFCVSVLRLNIYKISNMVMLLIKYHSTTRGWIFHRVTRNYRCIVCRIL